MSLNDKIIETIQKLNRQYGRELNVLELMENSSAFFQAVGECRFGDKKEKDTDEFMMVHLTNFLVGGSKIITPFESKHSISSLIEFKGFDLLYRRFRDTVHFTVNTTVADHDDVPIESGKYCVFIPLDLFLQENGQMVRNCRWNDFWVKGSPKIPSGSYILCPISEVKEIRDKNSNVNVIGYPGENVLLYSNLFLNMILQVNVLKFDKHGVAGIYDSDFQKRLQRVVNQILKKEVSFGYHSDSHEYAEEKFLSAMDMLEQIINIIKKNDLLKQMSKDDFKNSISIAIAIFAPTAFSWEEKSELDKYVSMVKNATFSFGCSELQAFFTNENSLRVNSVSIRMYESLKIDEFLEKDISEIYEDDMLITNIKRINLILEKIEKDNLYEHKNSLMILDSAVNHLQDDYIIILRNFDKIKAYNDKFNLKEYQRKLDGYLSSLGITHKYLEKDNLKDILLEERKVKQFLAKNNFSFEDDFILNMLSSLNSLFDLICKRFYIVVKMDIDDEIFSQAYHIYKYLIKKLKMVDAEDYLAELRKDGSDIKEYLLLLEQKLNYFGISIDDFLKKERKGGNISDRMEKALDQKLDLIEMIGMNQKEELAKKVNVR